MLVNYLGRTIAIPDEIAGETPKYITTDFDGAITVFVEKPYICTQPDISFSLSSVWLWQNKTNWSFCPQPTQKTICPEWRDSLREISALEIFEGQL